MLSVSEAHVRILTFFEPVATLTASLYRADGCVPASDTAATADVPPFRRLSNRRGCLVPNQCISTGAALPSRTKAVVMADTDFNKRMPGTPALKRMAVKENFFSLIQTNALLIVTSGVKSLPANSEEEIWPIG